MRVSVMFSSQADEYRKRAEECRSTAQGYTDQESRSFWLDLAQRWDESAEKAEELAKATADDQLAIIPEAA